MATGYNNQHKLLLGLFMPTNSDITIAGSVTNEIVGYYLRSYINSGGLPEWTSVVSIWGDSIFNKDIEQSILMITSGDKNFPLKEDTIEKKLDYYNSIINKVRFLFLKTACAEYGEQRYEDKVSDYKINVDDDSMEEDEDLNVVSWISTMDVQKFIQQVVSVKIWSDSRVIENQRILEIYIHLTKQTNMSLTWRDIDMSLYKVQYNDMEGIDINDDELSYTEEFEELEKLAWKNVVHSDYHIYIDKMNLTALKKALTDFKGRSFRPKGWQVEFLVNHKRFNSVAASRRSGKCVSENAEIRMFDGSFKKAKDIVDGELLLASDKKSFVTVRGLERFKKQSIKVTLADGSSFIVSDDHRVPTQHTFKNGKRDMNFDNYKVASELKKGDFIPRLLNIGEKDNINDSYEEGALVGYSLGNGSNTSKSFYVSSFNDILSNRLISYAEKLGYDAEYNDEKKHVFIKNAMDIRGKYNLYGLSKDKYMSQEIFKGSHKFKWGLIEGLICTDGYIGYTPPIVRNDGYNRKGRVFIEYSSVSEKLVSDFQKLLLDVGVMSHIKKYNKNVKCMGRKYNVDVYFLYITGLESLKAVFKNTNLEGKKNYIESNEYINNTTGYTNSNLSTIPLCAFKERTVEGIGHQTTYGGIRKPRYNFQRWKCENYGINQWLEYSWTEVVSVESVGEQNVIDIEVDGDHLYWYDNILTHNTLLAAYLIIRQMLLPNQVIAVIVPTLKNHARPIARYIERYMGKDPDFKYDRKENIIKYKGDVDSEVIFYTSEREDSVRGESINFRVTDEAAFCSEAIMYNSEATLASAKGWSYSITTVNPITPKNHFYDTHIDYEVGMMEVDSIYYARRVPISENPFIEEGEKQILLKQKEKNPIRYQAEYECIFQDGTGLDTSNFWVLDIDDAHWVIPMKDGREVKLKITGKLATMGIQSYVYYIISHDGASLADSPGLTVWGYSNGRMECVIAEYLKGYSYYDQVEIIDRLWKKFHNNMKEPDNSKAVRIVDYSGAGIPLAEIYNKETGSNPILVQWLGGVIEVKDGSVWRVGKDLMVGKMKAIIGSGNICGYSFQKEYRIELEKFDDKRVRKNGNHMDLFASSCMAVWYGDKMGMIHKDQTTATENFINGEFEETGYEYHENFVDQVEDRMSMFGY